MLAVGGRLSDDIARALYQGFGLHAGVVSWVQPVCHRAPDEKHLACGAHTGRKSLENAALREAG